MSFRIDPTQPLDAEIRRIAAEQLDKAAAALREPTGDRHAAIHDVRKRTKKLRALLRLVRSADAALYRAENRRLRDLARAFSGARDRTAVIEAVRDLAEGAAHANTRNFRPMLATLEARRNDATAAEDAELDAKVALMLDGLAACRARFETFGVSGKAAGIVSEGLVRNYARARQALRTAQASGSADDFHALRKRGKTYAHHLRLVSPLWPELAKPLHEAAAKLGEDLGRDHDYAVLLDEIEREPASFGTEAQREKALAHIRADSARLRDGSFRAARRLFAQKPKAARRYLKTLWREVAGPS